jgi:hypothetical protein
MNREELAEQCRLERLDCQDTFNKIKAGQMTFEDFYYGWLDNIRNVDFDHGYEHAMETVEDFIQDAEGDIDYVRFLIEKDRHARNGELDII